MSEKWSIFASREASKTYRIVYPYGNLYLPVQLATSKNEQAFFMLLRLSRKTHQKVVGVPEHRRAVAFAIFVKTRCPASVLKDWSYRGLSRLTSLSPNTCKKRVACLEDLGLITREVNGGHTYLRFAPLRRGAVRLKRRTWRPKNADVNIGGFSGESIKEIERGLMALVIVEDCNRKNYIRQLTSLAHNPSKYVPTRQIKRAKAICSKRGYGKDFQDYGLSYDRIRQWLHCGPNMVKDVIFFGESTRMFVARRSEFVFLKYIHDGAKFAVEYLQQEVDFPIFATKSNVFRRPANSFTALGVYCQTI